MTTRSVVRPATTTYGLSRYFSSKPLSRVAASSGADDVARSKKKKASNKQKFKINQITPEQSEKLAAAFDELARKEGFTPTDSHFTSEDTFDDDFDDDDYVFPKELSGKTDHEFVDDGVDYDSMDDRIASAQRDMDLGRVTVPEDLDKLAQDIGPRTLRELGFRPELNPFEGDGIQRQEKYKLVTEAMTCPACGSDFQTSDESRPGFLPKEKFEVQQKLDRIDKMRRLQQKSMSDDWTPEDEVDWLIQTSGKEGTDAPRLDEMDIYKMAENMGIDLDALTSAKPTICKRCFDLQHSGKVDVSLRPGWTEDPLLAQATFRKLLKPIATRKAVIIALVDLFDFAGSVLPELDNIAGSNPVIVAANKADLLPSKMGPVRAEQWVRRELKYLGIKSLANVGGAVRLVSCKTGDGVYPMLDKARQLADEMECDIYVVGAANAGKSTLINYILRNRKSELDKLPGKKRAGNKNKYKTAVTASPLPGTTLRFIKVMLPEGKNLYDTPGLLVPGTLTHMLTPEELKLVVPRKRVEPVTYNVANGKCVMIGGLAYVGVVGESRSFFLSVFVSNDIKIHKTDLSKAEEVRRKHAGELLQPPLPPGPERIEEIGEFEHHVIDIKGSGWKEAAADIALTGLGWIAVTGAGDAQIQVSVPKGIAVSVRPPLMPFDIRDSTARYTGGRSVRSGGRRRRGGGVPGVGRKF